MRFRAVLFLLGLAACGHEPPFSWAGPDTLGPPSAAVPRRLTFNPGDDRNPSAIAGTLVFSRLDGTRGRERCLAFLAPTGGTLRRTVCPPPPAAPADTFIDTWVEPVLSPDGTRVAYVWQKGAPSSYYTWTRDLVVAPADDPGHPTFTWQTWYVLPDGRVATAVAKPMWLDSGRLRFLAAYDSVFKVKGGGAERLTDTLTNAYALLDLELTTGRADVVPGADSTIAYAPAPGGGLWLVKSSDSMSLLLLGAGPEAAVRVAGFSGPVVDLANVAGVPVALLALGGDSTVVEWLDLTTAARGQVGAVTPIRRISAVPGTRWFVAEVEKSAEPLSSEGANLWLFGIP